MDSEADQISKDIRCPRWKFYLTKIESEFDMCRLVLGEQSISKGCRIEFKVVKVPVG
ncbi:predicted protein [Sclerotinia sclerotiorum 1980 UF-70]|uniref:Uncharacterized protein n=1 Tax=Sclerotinia sclerotiorum (strain ATCC 18683 / 1980 / Ss-1) TaxID=665079 RepID=A7EJC0_SCLS1|nr:predicted protein [Sclerotinia sclerotiorum 1980 UF-70]EDO02936.1 predicted protein [Sclerotinia sclerotiorum 1980 UF-70]